MGSSGAGGNRGGDEEWKATAVYHFGSKKSSEVDELPQFDFGLPRQKYDAQYLSACSHVQWLDPEWKGREKTVISDLTRKNQVLENQIKENEAEKQSIREKHKVEKKMLARIHKEQLMCRDRMLVFAITICFGLCAILYAVASRR